MYKIKFTSPTGSKIEMEVNAEVYALFEAERKFQQRIAREYNRRLDHRHIEDIRDERLSLNWSVYASKVEDKENMQELLAVLDNYCTEKQARRFLLYFEGYTIKEIAKMEECTEAAVSVSIRAAKEKVKKFYFFQKSI